MTGRGRAPANAASVGRRPRARPDRLRARIDLAGHPRAGQAPGPLDRRFAHAQRLGGLRRCVAGEVAALGHARGPRVDRLEPLQQVVDQQHLVATVLADQPGFGRRTVEIDSLGVAAALVPRTVACVVDQDPPHRGAGHGEELGPIGPAGAVLPGQLHEGLVDQGSGRKRMTASLATEVVLGEPAQFIVDVFEGRTHSFGRGIVGVQQRCQARLGGVLGIHARFRNGSGPVYRAGGASCKPGKRR